MRETEKRMQRLGVTPADLDAILVTHEHSDHISGVGRFARRHDIPVWMTPGTHAACPEPSPPQVREVNCHRQFRIGGLDIMPIPVPHDAREPCQYRFDDGQRRLGILTDTGHVTPHIVECLDGCHVIAVEFNHDVELLRQGPYPPTLKNRVGGRHGHLNNDQAADLLKRVDRSNLQRVVAVHLSEVNNCSAVVRRRMTEALESTSIGLCIADQETGSDWYSL